MSSPRGNRPIIDGHSGPSNLLPRDSGGVEMRAAPAVHFNRAADPHDHGADLDPVARKRLPLTMIGLMLVLVVFTGWFNFALGVVLALIFAVVGGLVYWLRAND